MSSRSAQAAFEPAVSSPPRFYGLLKASTAFLATTMLIQGITAGLLLDGTENGGEIHRSTSSIVIVALVITITAAILVRRNGGPIRPLATCLVTTVLTLVQYALGENGSAAVHVPLGVALMGGATALAVQVWGQRGTG
ncbi:hypothetical protein BJF79_25770 [Actinomadura sp. CNU-125]|uniref:hypothetical protein n=1 Tax=Actinomadura sp. CNU-125 TaxID=1904961 RepID=UPI000963C93A|nr:hypothetical protein [Actinomadura sp. CNU-125]OLT10570.1 hypothetical protein BJF79_25770 [Actinomadura sp. CNU-125]